MEGIVEENKQSRVHGGGGDSVCHAGPPADLRMLKKRQLSVNNTNKPCLESERDSRDVLGNGSLDALLCSNDF
jgi:hypothetical protein